MYDSLGVMYSKCQLHLFYIMCGPQDRLLLNRDIVSSVSTLVCWRTQIHNYI